MHSPETALYTSVLNKSFLDLFGSVPSVAQGETIDYRAEALAFLTNESGAWAQSRENICAIVGKDADKLRQRVVDILESDVTEFATYDNNICTNVEAARKLWNERAANAAKAADERAARQAKIKAKKEAERQMQAEIDAVEDLDIDVVLDPTRIPKDKHLDAIIDALSDGPLTSRKVLFATAGAMSREFIAKTLKRGTEAGIVERIGDEFHLIETSKAA